MRLALFEPDIPQNAGTLMRLGACLGVGVDVIGPCGFLFSDSAFRRAGMDYLDQTNFVRHESWAAYLSARGHCSSRLVLLSTKATRPYTEFPFEMHDTTLLGRESAGAPDFVHAAAHARLRIPLRPGMRSLNVALAGAMVLGEALRQIGGFPS
jgi:tRNA (cytidine/uridine-2'-O-)-methyltransferase